MERPIRNLFGLALLIALVSTPAFASSISVVVGDKDGFGVGVLAGQNLPWLAPIQDVRSAAEKAASDGAQLTDVYSALYSGTESDCGSGFQLCSPNGATGFVILPFQGQMLSGTLSFLAGDFEALQNGAMLATINGVPVSFAYNHGFQKTQFEQIVLTPAMIAAANKDGAVRLFLDHTAFFDPQNPANSFGSFDYIAFDYFELNAEVVPEPGTLLLLSTGLAALAARRFRSSRDRT